MRARAPNSGTDYRCCLHVCMCSCRADGGVEAERTERARQKEEAAAKDRRNFEWLQQLRREGFRKVRCRHQQRLNPFECKASSRMSHGAGHAHWGTDDWLLD